MLFQKQDLRWQYFSPVGDRLAAFIRSEAWPPLIYFRFVIAVVFAGCTPTQQPTHFAGTDIHVVLTPSKVSPIELDVGELACGGAWSGKLFFHNNAAHAISFASIDPGCSCLAITDLPETIDPHATAVSNIRLDLRDDPEFSGGLGIPVAGFDSRGRKLFDMRVVVNVVARPSVAQTE